jgi:hypothetical protein
MMHASFYLRFLTLLGALFASVGCSFFGQKHQGRPNIIILSIEGLNFDKMSCGDPMESSGGFSQLCSNSFRFTHFYSPSTMSQVAMASLLTGMNPVEHKVLDNGNTFIPEAVQTLPEKALAAGYRTAFFTGGPPILCKSGLQQGFENCDDDFLTSESIFRPVQFNLDRAKNWIKEQEGPFFLNLFSPDTQFYTQTTVAQDGKERSKTMDSQIDEIDESLGLFLKLWVSMEKV